MGNTPPQTEEDSQADQGRSPREGRGREEVDCAPSLPPQFTRRYEVVQKIGKGAFGIVYKVRDRRTKGLYAAKHVEYNESNRKEVQIQADIDADRVVKIVDTISVPEALQLFIVMEYCEGGNLREWIRRNRKHSALNETVILQMFYEICEAVYSCHQGRVVHRDLKPENVLLDSRRRIKLADFGVARVLDRTAVAKSFCGTPPYMAPELFLSYLGRQSNPHGAEGYDHKCDVWSIGCILWDMANSTDTFVYDLTSNLGYSVSQASSDSMGAREIGELIERDVPKEFVITKKLLRQMLKKNPDERASLSEILQDRELRQALENPVGGHWSDIYDKVQ